MLCLVDVQRFHQKTISANFPHQRDLPVQVESSKDLLQLHDFARGEALADLADDGNTIYQRRNGVLCKLVNDEFVPVIPGNDTLRLVILR